MDPKKFIQPKEITIDGTRFVISKIPAVQAQQIYGALMKESKDDGDVAMTYLSEDTSMALASYCAVVMGDEGSTEWKALDSVNNVNLYCGNIEKLIKLEAAAIRYNFSFLFDGTLQEVLEVLRDAPQPDTSAQP